MGYEEIKTGRFSLFGRKSRAEKLKEQAESNSLVPMAALSAAFASQGSKRIRGEKVRTRGGRGGRLLFLLLAAAVGFLFLNPRTGPQARKFVGDAYGSLTSGE